MENQLTLQKLLNHPIQKVWAAISEPKQMEKWWMVRSDFKAEPGYNYDLKSDGGQLTGTVLEVDPPHKLVYTFLSPKHHMEAETTVIWTLEEQGNATLLTLVHKDFDKLRESRQSVWEGVSKGWPKHLASLEEVLAAMDKQEGTHVADNAYQNL
ncbi:MAG: SRPBCC domain-containing protein [Sphingobacteriales bacterium]